MDPIVFAALCGVGTGIVGFMMGGALFNATWKLLARKAAREMQEVRRDFMRSYMFDQIFSACQDNSRGISITI